jgi:hypothetical protein
VTALPVGTSPSICGRKHHSDAKSKLQTPSAGDDPDRHVLFPHVAAGTPLTNADFVIVS